MLTYSFNTSSLVENKEFLEEYLQSLSVPMDSYLEDHLEKAVIYSILVDDSHVGFLGLVETTMWFLFVTKTQVQHAAGAFEAAVQEFKVVDVYFQTQDVLMVSLVMDWEFDKKKSAYFFEDAYQIAPPSLPYTDVEFVAATKADLAHIQQETNNFFDESDLKLGTIYMLRSGDNLLGCGISVPGRYCKEYTSIGMVTCANYRRQGVGKYILWQLKELSYQQGLKPIAGCWYYNTLSRKSLQSVGFITRARGMRAMLREKEYIPERTGNYPGEPILNG